jgi:hypothetical protein
VDLEDEVRPAHARREEGLHEQTSSLQIRLASVAVFDGWS